MRKKTQPDLLKNRAATRTSSREVYKHTFDFTILPFLFNHSRKKKKTKTIVKGSNIVSWLIDTGRAASEEDALLIAQDLVNANMLTVPAPRQSMIAQKSKLLSYFQLPITKDMGVQKFDSHQSYSFNFKPAATRFTVLHFVKNSIFGQNYYCFHEKKKEYCIVKFIKKANAMDVDYFYQLLIYLNILGEHPNVLLPTEVLQTEDQILLCTMLGTRAWKYFEYFATFQPFTEIRVLETVLDISRGLSHIHETGKAFNNLNFNTIYIVEKKENDPRVTTILASEIQLDFGKESQINTYFTAPETINQNIVEPKSDIWSLGVCVYTILRDMHLPYFSSESKYIYKIFNAKIHFPEKKDLSASFRIILLQFLNSDIKKRPSSAEIIELCSTLDVNKDEDIALVPENNPHNLHFFNFTFSNHTLESSMVVKTPRQKKHPKQEVVSVVYSSRVSLYKSFLKQLNPIGSQSKDLRKLEYDSMDVWIHYLHPKSVHLWHHFYNNAVNFIILVDLKTIDFKRPFEESFSGDVKKFQKLYNNTEIFDPNRQPACNPSIHIAYMNHSLFEQKWKSCISLPEFEWAGCKQVLEPDQLKDMIDKLFFSVATRSSISSNSSFFSGGEPEFNAILNLSNAEHFSPSDKLSYSPRMEKVNLRTTSYRKAKSNIPKDFYSALYENIASSEAILKDLNLRYNFKDNYDNLFSALQHNKSLTVLNLSGNRLGDSIKELFASLENTRIESLIISECNLRPAHSPYIQQFISSNTNLTLLDLSYNAISDIGLINISEGLLRNNTLKHLELYRCGFSAPGIASLAKVVARHPRLETLNIDGNNVDCFSYYLISKSFSEGFSSNLSSFQIPFSLNNLILEDILKKQKVMKETKLLVAKNCQWEEVISGVMKKTPQYINLSNLKQCKLKLDGKSIESVLGINLSANLFTEMPKSLLIFPNLRIINFSSNSLHSLSIQLKYFPYLEELYLHSNNLCASSDIEHCLIGCKNLRILDLRFNNFSRCPSVAELTNLKELLLDNNPITSIPKYPSTLELLSLFGTQLNSTVTTILNYSTKQLQHLNLSCCKLKYLPMEIGLMNCLLELNLHSNELTFLPPQMENLSSLKILDLSNNQFSTLNSIVSISNLDLVEINISNNPFPSNLFATPVEGNNNNYTAIKKQLIGSIQKTIKLPKMKLAIVGPQNVGKTAIAKLLLASSDIKSLKKTISSLTVTPTEEIEISTWEADTKSDFPITYSVWDFSGNEIYHTPHLFFLNNRTIFLLAFNMAIPESKQRQQIKFWLDMLTSCTNSPIILVGTHLDEFSGDMEDFGRIYSDYGTKYNNISMITTFSSTMPATVELLRDTVLDISRKQQFLTKNVSGGYTALENLIKSESRILYPPLVSMSDFEKMIISCGIDGSSQTIAEFVTLLGISYFAKGLSNGIVTLDPQWFVTLINTLITYKEMDRGYFYHSKDMPKIFASYPTFLYESILEIFNKMELVYTFTQLHQEKGKYSVVPFLLDTQRPLIIENHWISTDDFYTLGLGVELERIYKFDAIKIPFGFFSRLVVRLLYFTSPLVMWRHGIICVKEDDVVFVECQLNNELSVKVRGKDPAKVLRLIVENIDLLLAGWYNIPLTIIVPFMIVGYQKALSDKYIFTLGELEQAAAQGKTSVVFKDGDATHDIPIHTIAPDLVLSDLSNIVINYSQLEIIKEIGRGGFGVVFKARYNGEIVAVKQVAIDDNMKTEAFREFRREVALSSQLHQPDIVELKCVCLDPWCLVMEFVEYGDLYSFLHNKNNIISWKMKLKIAQNIAEAIRFLHSFQPKIIHRDLKSPNCLVCDISPNAEHIVKVTDFGESRAVATSYSGRDRLQNPVWLAPEIMKKEQYTEKADVFSFGIILWELVVREKPFSEFEVAKSDFTFQLEDAIIGGLRPTIPNSCSIRYRELIEECWDGDPKKRPQFEDICKRIYALRNPSKSSSIDEED